MSTINISTVDSLNVHPNRAENDLQLNGNVAVQNRSTNIETDASIAEPVVNNNVESLNNNVEHESKNQISSEQLKLVAQKLQDFVGEMNKGLEFSVDKDSGRDVIKVIDKNSGDLIKQYPTEEVLDLVAKLSEATGNFINTDV